MGTNYADGTVGAALKSLKADLSGGTVAPAKYFRRPDGPNIAYYFDKTGNKLYYSTSSRAQIPAALRLFGPGREKDIIAIIDTAKGAWLDKVPGSPFRPHRASETPNVAKLQASLDNAKHEKAKVRTQQRYNEALGRAKAHKSEKTSDPPEELPLDGATGLRIVAFDGPAQAPSGVVGLYAAAKRRLALKSNTGSPDPRSGAHTRNKDVLGSRSDQDKADPDAINGRLLRYYQLATYALVTRAEAGSPIAAMMVSDDGRILSAAVNNGDWRHAETSMLLHYFMKNQNAQTIPPRSIIFSTLCPCVMCTAYMATWNTSADPAVIFFGQMDPGKSGKEGADNPNTVRMSDVMKEPTIAWAEAETNGGGFVYQGDILKARVEWGVHEACRNSSENTMANKLKGDDARRFFSGAAVRISAKADEKTDFPGREAVLDYLKTFLAQSGVQV